jgi:uncharacterized protein YndB with AHSA1/START domain
MAGNDPVAAVAADAGFTLTLTRLLDAPPLTLYRAWTDAGELARWLGPPGVEAEILEMDARVGGRYRIAMHRPDGGVTSVFGTYREMTPGERLSFTWEWEKKDLACQPGAAGGSPMAGATLVTVTFRAQGRRTEMTLHQGRLATAEARDSHAHGWTGSFERLAARLASSSL